MPGQGGNAEPVAPAPPGPEPGPDALIDEELDCSTRTVVQICTLNPTLLLRVVNMTAAKLIERKAIMEVPNDEFKNGIALMPIL
ncbi:hypothetical protein MTO96_044033 [Rhipicephalus appendiculatus]